MHFEPARAGEGAATQRLSPSPSAQDPTHFEQDSGRHDWAKSATRGAGRSMDRFCLRGKRLDRADG